MFDVILRCEINLGSYGLHARVRVLFKNEVTQNIHLVSAHLRNATGMANNISYGESVTVDEDEIPDAALCEFDCRVGAARSEAEAKDGSFTQEVGFEDRGASAGEGRLYFDQVYFDRLS